MKSFVLLGNALVLSLASGVQAAPKAQIDARGVALLDREIARLKALKSFSVQGVETTTWQGEVRTTKLSAALQWPYRAALRQTESDVSLNGKAAGRLQTLLGKAQVFTLDQDARSKPQNISSVRGRANAYVWTLSTSPSLIYSFMPLSAGVNLGHHKLTVAVRVVRLRIGKSNLRNVIVHMKAKQPEEPLEIFELGFDGRGFLRRFAGRFRINGKPAITVTHFKPVQSNWKGSQARTDALVYNWNSLSR